MFPAGVSKPAPHITPSLEQILLIKLEPLIGFISNIVFKNMFFGVF